MNSESKTLIILSPRWQKDQARRILLSFGLFFLIALACNVPWNGSTPAPGEIIGSIERERAVVWQGGEQVVEKNRLKERDKLSVSHGGVGLLDFGGNLHLRLFNTSVAGEILGTTTSSDPNSSFFVQLTLFAGGFSGQLVEPDGEATFKVPGGATIRVYGTKFFVVYDPDTSVTTVGNFSGIVGVTVGGEWVILTDGHYIELRPGETPGEQKIIPFTFQQFEDRARERESPVLALIEVDQNAVAQVSPTPTNDPFSTDTDNDGLVDAEEDPPCPDPANPDTDGDGFIDGFDLNPCDANNPYLTATAIASIPTATQSTPIPPPTQVPTLTDTGVPEVNPVSVPNTVGMGLATGRMVISEAGLQVGQITEEKGYQAPKDTIIRQSPRQGQEVSEGTVVDLVIAAERVIVPDVRGYSKDEGAELLQAAGYEAQVTEQPTYHLEPGEIIDQDPPGGEPAPEGSTVNLSVGVVPKGSALQFDGVDDFVNIIDAAQPYTENWFLNSTEVIPTPTPSSTQVPVMIAPKLRVASVEQDKSITVQTDHLPPDSNFIVTMSPMAVQGANRIVVASVSTGTGGSKQFTFSIPTDLHGDKQISVRMESTAKGNFDFDNTFTLEAWVKPFSLESGEKLKAVVFGESSDTKSSGVGWTMFLNNLDHTDWGLGMCVPSSALRITVVSNCRIVSSGPGNLKVDQWQHMAATYTASEIIIYRNGEEVSRQAHLGEVQDIGKVLIGFGLESFHGLVDEVLIWNTARTEAQILEDMNQNVEVKESGLVSYWRFNEGKGQSVFDSSLKGNHGWLGATVEVDLNDPMWVKLD
jgi:hypothetical protein